MEAHHTLSRIVVIAVLVGALFTLIGLQALAQADSVIPAAPPAQNTASTSVDWEVGRMEFESHYPAGFEFRLEIRSSAAPIERARIVWTHVPGTQRTRPAEVNPDTGILTAVWEATGADAVPPNIGITYYWEVTDEVGNAFQTDPVYTEYEDPTREWVRTESDDVIVFSQGLPEDVGQVVVDAMAEQRDFYRVAWGDLLPYKPRAILFGDWAAWVEWQLTPVRSTIAGTTRSDWGATVQRVIGADFTDLAYGLVLHEIGHMYQDEFVGFLAVNWFSEGNATFFELDQQYDYEGKVRRMAAEGRLPVLLQSSGPSIRGRNARDGYDIGYTFFKWLTDIYGLEAHRDLMQAIHNGMTRNVAIEFVTGLSLQEVESQWRVWLGASPDVPALVPTPTFYFLPSPTPFGQ